MTLRRTVLPALCVTTAWLTLVLGAGAAGRTPSSPQAQQFQQKLRSIEENAGRTTVRPQRVTLFESELNAFLGGPGATLPAGILNPKVTLLGSGQVSGTAIVDLDAVRKSSQSSAFSPMAYLSGKLPVSVTGVLTSHDGQAQFALQSAQVNGLSVPKVLINELVAYYLRSADLPSGLSLDSPFPLPDRIKQIDVQRGQAIIIQ
ncbi:MAG TPA: hypothetical protein VIC33_04995 [Vicinamibacterales bacterium]